MAVQYLGRNGDDGVSLGNSTSELISFYGYTPIAQRTKSTISGTVSTSAWVAVCSTKWGAKSSTWFTKITNTVNELKATMCALGLHKGGA